MEAGGLKYCTLYIQRGVYPIGLLRLARQAILPQNFRFRRNCQHPRAEDGTTMFVTPWEFEVKSGSEDLFERTYGPEGEWARLFRPDARYRGTRLLRDVGAVRVYVTMDSWKSREAYEKFREKFAAEYEELHRKCEGMTVRERNLGAHES
jgi:hypothetical protein